MIVQADHADSPQLPVAVFDPNSVPIPGPLEISDDQVFIHKAGPLTIIPDGGEGEFTNLANFHDVNADGSVNGIDILMLINDLTQNGPRPLNQLAIALTGVLPPGYLDVNIDAQVNTIDILALVNYLRSAAPPASQPARVRARGAAALPPERRPWPPRPPSQATTSPAMSSLWASGQPVGLRAVAGKHRRPVSRPPANRLSSPAVSDEDEPTSEVAASTAGDTVSTSGRSESGEVDSEAADEVFSSLSNSFRERLRNRRLARPLRARRIEL